MYQMHILLKKLVCATDSIVTMYYWQCHCDTNLKMGLQKMHFYVPLRGNAFWKLTEGEILWRQKKNSQLLSCRFVGENPAGLTFRCQLENATPISHFHLKKAKPFFPNASFLCFVQQKWLIVSEFACHLYMSSYTKFWLVSTCSCLLYTIKLKL